MNARVSRKSELCRSGANADEDLLSQELPFSERTRKLRARLGWSQERLSETLGTSSRSVQNWESGSSPRNLDQHFQKLCRSAPRSLASWWAYGPTKKRASTLMETRGNKRAPAAPENTQETAEAVASNSFKTSEDSPSSAKPSMDSLLPSGFVLTATGIKAYSDRKERTDKARGAAQAIQEALGEYLTLIRKVRENQLPEFSSDPHEVYLKKVSNTLCDCKLKLSLKLLDGQKLLHDRWLTDGLDTSTQLYRQERLRYLMKTIEQGMEAIDEEPETSAYDTKGFKRSKSAFLELRFLLLEGCILSDEEAADAEDYNFATPDDFCIVSNRRPWEGKLEAPTEDPVSWQECLRRCHQALGRFEREQGGMVELQALNADLNRLTDPFLLELGSSGGKALGARGRICEIDTRRKSGEYLTGQCRRELLTEREILGKAIGKHDEAWDLYQQRKAELEPIEARYQELVAQAEARALRRVGA